MNKKQQTYTGITTAGAILLVLVTILDLFYFTVSLWSSLLPTLMVLAGLGLLSWETDNVDALVSEGEQDG